VALGLAVALAACSGGQSTLTTDGGGSGNAGGSAGGSSGSPGSGGSGAGGASGTGAGGSTGAAGTTGAGGVPGAGGAVGGGGGAGGAVSVSCPSPAVSPTPFGCGFAWGRNAPGGSLSAYSYLQFMSSWVGSEVRADGTLNGCSGCSWVGRLGSTSLLPVFYAYFIGFYGHANGLPDGNSGGPPNLTTGGAALIKANRAKIIQMYTSYAQQVHQVWSTKPLVWLLEGDFIQYQGSTQTSPLSWAELGALAADIACAIKTNMPNAVVAINHSTWNSNADTASFWAAMTAAGVNYDMVWTSGEANANGFFNSTTNAGSYNGATATYAYIHNLTGRRIFVDTSFGASAIGDAWSTAPASAINARIADGVIAANVASTPAAGFQGLIAGLTPSLTPVCP
jgi:hypothetical protein